MMAFNPLAFNAQLQTPIKADDSSAEALRILASNPNFLTAGGPPLMPQIPMEAVRAMLPAGFPFPLVYPGLAQDFSNGGGPIPPFLMDASFGFHPYGDGARRKNATRETTAPLKEWLNSHRTNPYPNKQEKIFLAVLTKMTLTQVSTWFANARRRLKKENGGSVSIKRPEGEDDDDDMADLDRPSSSTSNLSGASNPNEIDVGEHNENSKLGVTPDHTPKKKMLSIDDILRVKEDKKDDEASSSKKDSPSSEESGPAAQAAFFQQMMMMYQRNPQLLAAMAVQRPGATAAPFSYPFNPLMMSMIPTTPTGAANGSFTSEATSASPSSSHSPAGEGALSKESSPQPKSE